MAKFKQVTLEKLCCVTFIHSSKRLSTYDSVSFGNTKCNSLLLVQSVINFVFYDSEIQFMLKKSVPELLSWFVLN